MKMQIEQREILKIIKDHLVACGAESKKILDIEIMIDKKTNECYCVVDVDLEVSDIFDKNKEDSLISEEDTLQQLEQSSKIEPNSNSIYDDLKKTKRIHLGAPKKVDEIDPLDDDMKF